MVKAIIRRVLYAHSFTKGICLKRVQIHNWRRLAFPILKERFLHPKRPFLIFTPEHSNIGDQAIAIAEELMFKKMNINYIEVTGSKLHQLEENGLLAIFNGKTILVHGGGFIGTLWFQEELLLRDILKCNPKSKIMMLPNTIYYETDAWGQEELRKSIEIYNAHQDFVIYARENHSFSFMKEIYHDVRLVPDMVLSLAGRHYKRSEREGCLLCLRDDCERTRNDFQEQVIRQEAEKLFGDRVKNTDMIHTSSVAIGERKKVVDDKMDEFGKAQLVITDRLHGMIFCAITGTPCIVVNSKSPKVTGSYGWIEGLDYIVLCDDVREIAARFASIPKKEHFFSNDSILPYYKQLEKEIRQSVER